MFLKNRMKVIWNYQWGGVGEEWIFSAASHYKFNPLNSIFAFMKLKMTDESVETCFVLKTTDVNFFL